MGLALMTKVRLIGHDSLRAAVVERLQAEGVLQFLDVAERADAAGSLILKRVPTADVERTLSQAQYVLDLIERVQPEKKGLLAGFVPSKPVISEESLRSLAERVDLDALYDETRALDGKLSALRAERGRMERLRGEIEPWLPIEIPVEDLRSTAHVIWRFGRVPGDRWEEFAADCERWFRGEVALEPAARREGKQYVLALMPAPREEEFINCASRYGFERLPALMDLLPEKWRGRPGEILAQIDLRLEQLDRKREQLVVGVHRLAAAKSELQALYDYWLGELLRRQAQNRLIGSRRTFMLEGWTRSRDLPKLRAALREFQDWIVLEESPPDPDEEPPVALENREFSKPAEVIVRLFGLPKPKELDPSPFVMPFFALFFGVALTDAGYGLALMAIFAFLKRVFTREAFRQFANLMIAGGFIAVIAGALTGGWFGPNLVEIIPPLQTLKLVDLNGSVGLVAFLGLTLVVGFVQVLLGHALEFYEGLRLGQPWEAVWHEGTWIALLAGLGLYAGIGLPSLVGMSGLPAEWAPFASNAVLLSLLLVICLSSAEAGRRPYAQLPWLLLAVSLWLYTVDIGNVGLLRPVLVGAAALWAWGSAPAASPGRRVLYMLGRVGGGLYKLYGITGFLGDVLSYSRIMALGIATGMIAMSINTFAVVIAGLLPETFGLPAAFGIALATLIVLVGQPISLAINALSAFVHSARLQYVEFFTKFYESGGRPFRPFTRESVYYELQPEGTRRE
jgi:V/A-type H+-transporting ATPase subunit I